MYAQTLILAVDSKLIEEGCLFLPSFTGKDSACRENWFFYSFVSRDQIDQAIHQKMIVAFNDPELTGRRFNVSHNPIFLDTIHFASSKHHFQDVIDKIDLAIERGTKNGQLTKLFKTY